MQTLATGEASTLGTWKTLVNTVLGPGPALDFLNRKIAEAPHGEHEEVIAHESQMLRLLMEMHFGDRLRAR